MTVEFVSVNVLVTIVGIVSKKVIDPEQFPVADEVWRVIFETIVVDGHSVLFHQGEQDEVVVSFMVSDVVSAEHLGQSTEQVEHGGGLSRVVGGGVILGCVRVVGVVALAKCRS